MSHSKADKVEEDNSLSIPEILADFFLKKIDMSSESDDSDHKHKSKKKKSKHKKRKHKKSKRKHRSSSSDASSSKAPGLIKKDVVDDVSSSEEIGIKRLKRIKSLKFQSANNPVVESATSLSVGSNGRDKNELSNSSTNDNNLYYGPSLELLISGVEPIKSDLPKDSSKVVDSKDMPCQPKSDSNASKNSVLNNATELLDDNSKTENAKLPDMPKISKLNSESEKGSALSDKKNDISCNNVTNILNDIKIDQSKTDVEAVKAPENSHSDAQKEIVSKIESKTDNLVNGEKSKSVSSVKNSSIINKQQEKTVDKKIHSRSRSVSRSRSRNDSPKSKYQKRKSRSSSRESDYTAKKKKRRSRSREKLRNRRKRSHSRSRSRSRFHRSKRTSKSPVQSFRRGTRSRSRSCVRYRRQSRSVSNSRKSLRSVSKSRKRSSSLLKTRKRSRSLSKSRKRSRSLSKSRKLSQSPSKQRKRSRSVSKSRKRSRSVSKSRKRSRSLSKSRKRSRSLSKLRKRSRSQSKPRKRSSSPSKPRKRSRSLSKSRNQSRSPSKPRKRSRSLSKSRKQSRSPSKPRKRSRSLSKSRKQSRSPSKPRKRSRSLSKLRKQSRSPSKPRKRSRSLSKTRKQSRSPSKPRKLSRSLSKSRKQSRSPSKARKRSRSASRLKKHSRSRSRNRFHSSSRSKRRSRSRSRYHSSSRSKPQRHTRSRSRQRHRSSSRSKERRRSRSKSRNRTKSKRSTSRSRSKSKSRRISSPKKRSHSRSRSKDRKSSQSSTKIDQAKILETARKNVLKMMKSGTMPEGLPVENLKKEQLISIQSGGKSVQELTDFCQRLSQKENDPDDAEDNDDKADDRTGFIHHPFKVKEPGMIKLNIKNAVQLPIKTHAQKIAETTRLSSQFPVSSGNQHKQKELEWIPVVPESTKSDTKPAAAVTVSTADASKTATVVNKTVAVPVSNAVTVPPVVETAAEIPPIPPLPPPPLPPLSYPCPAPVKAPPVEVSAPVPAMMPPPMPPPLLQQPVQCTTYYQMPPQPEMQTYVTANNPVMMPPFPSVPVSAPSTSVFKPPRKLDISSIVTKRFQALTKLQESPNDPEAINTLQKAQESIQEWVQSQQVPGLFTGSTDAKILSAAELCGPFKHYKCRKDMLTHAPPVTEGKGMSLLKKMGWNPGEGLGKNKEGSLEPLVLDIKTDKKGLVSEGENSKKGINSYTKELQGKHPVSALMELCSKRRWKPPLYNCVLDHGPAHKKVFCFKVEVNGVEYQPLNPSLNKKVAKADAAILCLQSLNILPKTT